MLFIWFNISWLFPCNLFVSLFNLWLVVYISALRDGVAVLYLVWFWLVVLLVVYYSCCFADSCLSVGASCYLVAIGCVWYLGA